MVLEALLSRLKFRIRFYFATRIDFNLKIDFVLLNDSGYEVVVVV